LLLLLPLFLPPLLEARWDRGSWPSRLLSPMTVFVPVPRAGSG
jgi:hypothetical protein